MSNWKVNSWRNKPVKHQPVYADQEKIDNVLKELSTFPPLVFAGEAQLTCIYLKAHLLTGVKCKGATHSRG